MNTTHASIEIPYEGNEEKWFVGNLNFMGYYRVNYDRENWLRIIAQLKKDHTVFSAIERAAFIFDVFTFARFDHFFIVYEIINDIFEYNFLFIKNWLH